MSAWLWVLGHRLEVALVLAALAFALVASGVACGPLRDECEHR